MNALQNIETKKRKNTVRLCVAWIKRKKAQENKDGMKKSQKIDDDMKLFVTEILSTVMVLSIYWATVWLLYFNFAFDLSTNIKNNNYSAKKGGYKIWCKQK